MKFNPHTTAMIAYSNELMDRLDAMVPQLAVKAFHEAHLRALDSGAEVLVSGDYDGHGFGLYQAFKDGSHRFIEPLPKPVHIKKGTRFVFP